MRKGGGWSQAHLDPKGFDIAPIRDVGDVDHEGQVHDRVAGQAGLESICVSAQQVACEEAAVTAATHCNPLLVHNTYTHNHGLKCSTQCVV